METSLKAVYLVVQRSRSQLIASTSSPSLSAFLEFSRTGVRSENKRVNGLKISHLFQDTCTDIEMQWKITDPGRLAWKIPKFITQKGERQASKKFHENSILRLVTVGGQCVGLCLRSKS